ncbi:MULTISPECIES: hypothetical protein [unclassified Francisella]|uniref:hypothetical protein n=1 Tax=unclassified Francisella TaxID=2610885 RepID=UPI002E2F0848|nr:MULTISPECIES: hypothetical protein [unclassified Francisella]MED7819107.1 hypothetical protein [Francisella sp. 19S2-4]MED7829933.1 hypothetical protein [Francisella sp. 19S2-10]
MQKLIINKSRKYRTIFYGCLIFSASFILIVYFSGSNIKYLGLLFILGSIFFEFKDNKRSIDAIVLPELDDNSLKFIIDNKLSDFWLIRRHIIINDWIYLYVIQQGSNKKLKIWFHKSNFNDQNDIRDLARYLLFN